MLAYWILFLVPAMAALNSRPNMRTRHDGLRAVRVNSSWALVAVAVTIFVGFRYEVGTDWGAYYRYYAQSIHLELRDLAHLPDPGYWAFNMFSAQFGSGMTGVNVISAVIFSVGLVIFCRSLPRPWLALAVAVPYLIIVVAMGYTRQGIAIGFSLIGLVMLTRHKFMKFAVWVLLGALFHKSAVLLLPIAGLSASRRRLYAIGFIGIFSVLGYYVLIQDSADRLLTTYVDQNIQSAGALIRLIMNAVPAILFVMFRRRFEIAESENRLWALFSWVSIAMFFVFFATNLSTALDRMALYLIPLQLVVFAHLPDAVGRRGGRNQAVVFGILLYYALVMFVWFSFGNFSKFWLPYQMGFS